MRFEEVGMPVISASGGYRLATPTLPMALRLFWRDVLAVKAGISGPRMSECSAQHASRHFRHRH